VERRYSESTFGFIDIDIILLQAQRTNQDNLLQKCEPGIKKRLDYVCFERSFSTSFGQGPIEEISAMVALSNGWKVQRAKDTQITIQQAKASAISDIMADLRSRASAPHWDKELKRVSQAQSRAEVSHKVRSHLWIGKKGGKLLFFDQDGQIEPRSDRNRQKRHADVESGGSRMSGLLCPLLQSRWRKQS
jgi:hypothetical protein